MCGLVLRFFVHGFILICVLKATVDEEMSMLIAGVVAVCSTACTIILTAIFAVLFQLIAIPVIGEAPGIVLGAVAGVLTGGLATGALLGVAISALFGTEIKRSMLAGGLYVVGVVILEAAITTILYLLSSGN